jgi:hypothetical protein
MNFNFLFDWLKVNIPKFVDHHPKIFRDLLSMSGKIPHGKYPPSATSFRHQAIIPGAE